MPPNLKTTVSCIKARPRSSSERSQAGAGVPYAVAIGA
jgi:hypothetical protein